MIYAARAIQQWDRVVCKGFPVAVRLCARKGQWCRTFAQVRYPVKRGFGSELTQPCVAKRKAEFLEPPTSLKEAVRELKHVEQKLDPRCLFEQSNANVRRAVVARQSG
jgi:hypothetical protein